MDLNKVLRPFKRKLLFETVINAVLLATTSSFFVVFLISLVYHILVKETPMTSTYMIGIIIFVIAFLIGLVLGYPTRKRVAIRLDAVGLQERISTMIALESENTKIAEIQRKDAIAQINQMTPRSLKMHVAKKSLIVCAISIFLAAAILFLPYNIFAFGVTEDLAQEEKEQIVKDLIEELREEVKQAELDKELKDALDEMIEELEEKLEDTESELEQVAKIEEAKEKMKELLEKALTKQQIGEALQKYELTRALGEAISSGDGSKVSEALGALEKTLSEDKIKVLELATTLKTALEETEVEADSLYEALETFSLTLSTVNVDKETFLTELEEAFDEVEKAILEALKKQDEIEEEKDKLEETLEDAKDKTLGNEKEEEPDEESKEEESDKDADKNDGEQSDKEQQEANPPNGQSSQGNGNERPPEGPGEGNTMTEGIFDPVLGNVPYGKVFAAYYAKYLEALKEGEVPKDLQEIMDKYFSSLN